METSRSISFNRIIKVTCHKPIVNIYVMALLDDCLTLFANQFEGKIQIAIFCKNYRSFLGLSTIETVLNRSNWYIVN